MFILPIGHDKAIYRLPLVTIGVMATCVLVQGWSTATGGGAIEVLGHRPIDGPGPSLLTSAFAHAGIFHLAGNMAFLWLTGATLEYRWGAVFWALFYLAAAFATALTFSLLHPDSAVPLVGASGAIAGAMGAFVVCLRTARIRFFYLYFIFFRPRHGTFEAPAYVALPLWFAVELFQAIFLEGEQGVAYSAHASGFLFGALIALGLRLSGIEGKLRAAVGSDVFDEDGAFLDGGPPARTLPPPSSHPALARPPVAAVGVATTARVSTRPELPDAIAVDLGGELGGEEPALPEREGDLTRAIAAGDREAVAELAPPRLEALAGEDPGAARALFAHIVEAFAPPLPLDARSLAIAARHATRAADLPHAMAATSALIVQHPDSRHVPDAMWRTAQLQRELGREENARRTIENLLRAYPESEAAKRARA